MSATRTSPRRWPPWLLVSVAWLVPAILAGLDAWAQRRLHHLTPITTRELLWESGDWLLYGLLTPLVFVISRRVPMARGTLRRTLPVHAVMALLLCVAWAAAGTLLRAVVLGNAPSWGFLISWISTTLPFGFAVYFAVVGLEHALRYFAEARDREVQAARLAAQLTDARMTVLQARLQPHFLFNSLNAVAVLVRDGNIAAANRMLELLSDMMRRVLAADAPQEIPLDRELDLTRQYLEIEQVRFSDRLTFRFEIDREAETALVPRLLLQPLVENAVRHGIAPQSGPGAIVVRARREADDLVITIANDGVPPAATTVAGVGLRNTRERLQTLHGAGATLSLSATARGALVTVRLPWTTDDA